MAREGQDLRLLGVRNSEPEKVMTQEEIRTANKDNAEKLEMLKDRFRPIHKMVYK